MSCVARPVDLAAWRPEAAQRADIHEDALLQRSVPKRRAEHLAGRLCAREALRQRMGLPIGQVPPAPGRLPDGGPEWPEGLTGSISHGAGWAVAVAAHAVQWRGLGVDVEAVMPPGQAWELAPGFLTDSEQHTVRRLHEGDLLAQARVISLFFSLKESAIKLLAPLWGRPVDFTALEVVSIDRETRRASLCVSRGWDVNGDGAATSSRRQWQPGGDEGRPIAALWAPWPMGADASAAVLTLCGQWSDDHGWI